MQHRELKAPQELQDTIDCFWYSAIDFGEHQTGFEILPDGTAEIIFHFGEPCSVLANGVSQPLPSPFIMGLLNQPVLLHTKNLLQVVGIKCFPWAVFDLLGLPSNNEGVNVFEHPISHLQGPLQQCIESGNVSEALSQVQQYFLEARARVATDTMLFKAGVAMRKANGTLPVSQVAAAAHATVRTLERKFKQSSGYTVKDVSGLIRFEQARNHLWLHPNASLAALAQELGYTDQSHLSREFKRYSGTSPAAFARKATWERQFIRDDFGVFIQD